MRYLVRSYFMPPVVRIVTAFTLAIIASCAATSRSTDAPQDRVVRGAPKQELIWAEFTPSLFAKAKAEGRFVVLDGSAEWCHWCHVMEAETYHDETVRGLLDGNFIAAKVDIDTRPDIAERYGDYGWPATVIFSPDGKELGKFRGFIAPAEFAEILKNLIADKGAVEPSRDEIVRRPDSRKPLSKETLSWIAHAVQVELDEYWDPVQGGWGRSQKTAQGWNNEWMLLLAGQSVGFAAEARKRLLFALDQQDNLMDPTWGGLYQYSEGKSWTSPHFEKLMVMQALALDNYAKAYALTSDKKQLRRATLIRRYIDQFMTSAEGGFFATQDADLNAHDRNKTFMTGHEYYANDDRARRALGVPRVDKHQYARENGLAIAAYCSLFQSTHDVTALAIAERAAQRILTSHRDARGGVTHDNADALPENATLLYLADNAAFGFALVRLFEVTGNEQYKAKANEIARFMLAQLIDEESGGLFASTVDPAAVGVFAKRRIPFEDNVMALRFLAHLARVAATPELTNAMASILRAIATPENIKSRGRFLGDFLLALEETKDFQTAP
jgi:uncharacterized protein